VNQKIGKYTISRQLGAGGMGVVYVGEHERLGKSVAIKVITPELSQDRQIVQRFFNEAAAATRIQHPGIIEVFDYGDDERTGSAYFVMELLIGEPLSSRITRERQLSSEVVVRLGAQMADTLAAAHDAGIVHRDLKPDNIFLVPDRAVAGGIRVKILDFGIAKLVANQMQVSAMTHTGAVMGTPSYMSPEQARGDSGSVDRHSDIYSLGCVLFHMACGRVPFAGEGLGEVLGAHLHVPPPPPRTLAPNLPGPLDALILACLEKSPEARPDSMHAVRTALEAMAPTISTTLGRGEVHQAASPPGGKRRGWAVPVAVTAVLAVGVAVALLAIPEGSGDGDDDVPPPAAKFSDDSANRDPGDPRADGRGAVAGDNPWIAVPAPAEPVILGVPQGTDKDIPGFRPDRRITAPTRSYELQRHEVTWGELEPWLTEQSDHALEPPDKVPADPAARARLPVIGIGWDTARAYCLAIGGRLPTEEEWEFAARGLERRPYPWGNRRLDLDRTHVYAGPDARVRTVESSTQDVTPEGIHDLIGNAQEWTVDLWREDSPGLDESWVQADGMTFRAIRGLPLASPPPARIPSHGAAYRETLCAAGPCTADAASITQQVGFRCARDGS